MIKPKIIFFTAMLLLNGCSQMSPIEKASESESHFKDAVFEGEDFYVSNKAIEGEKYRIFHQGSTGFTGMWAIRESATARANEFCKKQNSNKKMLTISERTSVPPHILGNWPRIEILFVCIDLENNVVDKYDQLSKIKTLRENGTITEEEFNVEKKKILSK